MQGPHGHLLFRISHGQTLPPRFWKMGAVQIVATSNISSAVIPSLQNQASLFGSGLRPWLPLESWRVSKNSGVGTPGSYCLGCRLGIWI